VVICVVPTADYTVSDTAKLEMRARTKIPRTVSVEIRVGDSLKDVTWQDSSRHSVSRRRRRHQQVIGSSG
jgi:hypothetical protein